MRKLLIAVSYIIINRRRGCSVVTLAALNPTTAPKAHLPDDERFDRSGLGSCAHPGPDDCGERRYLTRRLTRSTLFPVLAYATGAQGSDPQTGLAGLDVAYPREGDERSGLVQLTFRLRHKQSRKMRTK